MSVWRRIAPVELSGTVGCNSTLSVAGVLTAAGDLNIGTASGYKVGGTTVTTGTIAVTAGENYDVSFTQPAGTIIRNVWAIPAGNIVTAGSGGDDLDWSFGTSAGGAQLVAATAILSPALGAETWSANTPLNLIRDSNGHAANAFVAATTNLAGVIGGPTSSEAIAIVATLYSAAERTLHMRLTPVSVNNLATAATTVKFVIEFQYL